MMSSAHYQRAGLGNRARHGVRHADEVVLVDIPAETTPLERLKPQSCVPHQRRGGE